MLFHLDPQPLIALVTAYGYVAVFPLTFILGPIIVIIAGSLVSLGYFDPVVMFLVLLAGDLTGDVLYYSLGRWGGRSFVMQWGRYIGITERRVSVFEEGFLKHDWKLILFAKTQVIGSAILFSAGAVCMSFGRYCLYNFFGSVVKTFLFEAVGFYLAKGVTDINSYAGYAILALTLLGTVFFGGYFFLKSYVRSRGEDFSH